MATNSYGFLSKRYRQPVYYRNIFDNYNAVYITEQGNTLYIEAQVHFLCSNKIGVSIESYQILLQKPDHRQILRKDIKTQKKAIEILETLLQKY